MEDWVRKILEYLAELAKYVPAVPRPKKKLDLYKRLLWTALVLIAYLLMSNIPLPGVSVQTSPNLLLMNIVFAANAGTLMQLGIGPIVTAGLVLQLLVGAKIIDLDLNDPEDKKLFTLAQKGFAVVLGILEAIGLVLSGSLWTSVQNGIAIVTPPPVPIMILDMILLASATLLVIIMDEMVQKGWGLGSGISLFIAASVVSGIAWEVGGWFSHQGQIFWAGLVPSAAICGPLSVIVGNPLGAPKLPFQVTCAGKTINLGAMPDLIGFIATIVMIVVIAYLSSVKINVPLSVQRMRGMRIKIPLNLLYVTNIPVLLAAIIFANIQAMAQAAGPNSPLWQVAYYLSPPRGLLEVVLQPLRMLSYSIALTLLSIAFGILWVELAGLDPATQAKNLIESGLHIPGARNDPRHLEKILAKYIYPLTILSSIIVALLVIVADIFGAYGTGTGLLLAVMILQQYYTMLTYERAIETYPLLRKVLGE